MMKAVAMSEDPTRAMPRTEEEPPPGSPPPLPDDSDQVQSIDQTGTQRKFIVIGGIGCLVLLCLCVALSVYAFVAFDSDDVDVVETTPTVVADTDPTATPEPTPTSVAEATPTVVPTPTQEPESTPTPEPEPTPESSPTPEPEPTEPEGPPGFGDGTYIIGEDIQPGLYFANNPTDVCYWERLSGFSGEIDDILANSFGGDRQIVQILEGDVAFSTNNCGTWTEDDTPVRDDPNADLADGIYRVGDEVAPGLWRSEGSEGMCYWARLSGFSGELDDIIANSFGGVGDLVQIQPEDAGFESSGCAPWVRSGD
jgi:hypothetical protein